YVDQDRAKGRGLLRDSIREAEGADTHDEDARHARTYSYTSLILDAAKEGDYDGALRLFGQELGFDAPDRCVLALTEDTERVLLVARGADGGTLGHYEGARSRRLREELTGVVPARMLAALGGCEQVRVLARAPLQGRSGLLPEGFAWSYWTRSEQPKPVVARPVHLVVTDVAYDVARKLKPLSWTPSFGPAEQRRVLRGAEATPSRVLGEMVEATEIDLATHGLISPVSDASYLVLAKESGPNGTDELRSRFIREAKLKGAPLVLLAACNAGRAAPVLREPVSLSNAFLEAGARAVISATKPIPDQESSTFFAGLRERLRAGASPAAALRDERQVWMQQGRGTGWIESVLLFE
ncbi:MAG TPA: CHAT domain-containing protein, partial [Longimicrobium sp.]|nr:CHAT domain-containing protein [Longimicrobium sp.]